MSLLCYFHGSGRLAGRVGSGRKFWEFIFCMLENLCDYSDPNLSMLARRCSVKFTICYCVVHYVYFSCMLRFRDFIFLKCKVNNMEKDVNTVF